MFTRSGTVWSPQGEKLTGGRQGPRRRIRGKGGLGYSVAVSGNGEYALIWAAPVTAGRPARRGVFLRTGTTWAQQAEAVGQRRGRRERIREKRWPVGNGRIHADRWLLDKEGVGAAWVFLRTGSTWAQQAKLTAKAGARRGPGDFGRSVAIAAEGEYAVIGAPADKSGVGAAWVFTAASTWTQQGSKLTKYGGETSRQGFRRTTCRCHRDGPVPR